jgi:hypothetical protein
MLDRIVSSAKLVLPTFPVSDCSQRKWSIRCLTVGARGGVQKRDVDAPLLHIAFYTCAPAARVSAANALLDRGYGKAPQHVTGENVSYFALLPQICESEEEWAAKFTPGKEMKTLTSEPEG